MNFNNSFYAPNTAATKEMAENRMIESGYTSFTFKSSSFSNGASFYFTLNTGEEVRVSDHTLTGSRAFSTIQIDLFPVKKISFSTSSLSNDDFQERLAKMIANRKA